MTTAYNRELAAEDVSKLAAFLRDIPGDERAFVKEGELGLELARTWTDAHRDYKLVADAGDAIIGLAIIVPGSGLSAHVGELRLIVSPRARGQGIGRTLARRALLNAVTKFGLLKLFVEVVADQDRTVQMFQDIGFRPEALLCGHLRDRTGNLRDVMLLSHFVQENWEDIKTLGIDQEF